MEVTVGSSRSLHLSLMISLRLLNFKGPARSRMACSLSNLPAIASTRSIPISAINGITARWKLQCNTSNTSTSINVLTFFPVGKRLQFNLGLRSPHQRCTNGLVVKAETRPENMAKFQANTTSKTEADQKLGSVAEAEQNTASKTGDDQKREVVANTASKTGADQNPGAVRETTSKTKADQNTTSKMETDLKLGVLGDTTSKTKADQKPGAVADTTSKTEADQRLGAMEDTIRKIEAHQNTISKTEVDQNPRAVGDTTSKAEADYTTGAVGHTASKNEADETLANTTSKNDADHKPTTVISPFGVADLFLPMRTMRQMLDTMELDALSARTPWCMMENENELKMRFDMPGLSKDDVKVSVVDHRFLVIEEKEKREKDLWSFYSTYNTRLMLPENYETNKIKTELNNGVLNLSIPRVKVESELKDLSQNCEMGKIVAEFRNGVLNITIPTSKVESKVKGLPVK